MINEFGCYFYVVYQLQTAGIGLLVAHDKLENTFFVFVVCECIKDIYLTSEANENDKLTRKKSRD